MTVTEGELVFTSLTKEALPVIRYRTRDLTRLLPPTARSMRRLARITGRSDDMLIIRGVNVFPSQIEELLLTLHGLTPNYVLEVTRESHLDTLTVNVECAEHLGGDAAARDRLGQQFAIQHQGADRRDCADCRGQSGIPRALGRQGKSA